MERVRKELIEKLPEPFGFYRHILKGDHLHFGLWPDDGSALPMEDAQQEMFTMLLSFFPKPPALVLDVGCGLGLSAALLSERGYRVTAIAPSEELIDYAVAAYGDSGADYRTLGFFDDDEEVFQAGRYDILFFQESAQYLHPLGDMLRKARTLLKDNGVLVLGDEVCYEAAIKSETAVHLSSEFTIAFAEHGFRVAENLRLGKRVSPTCDFVIQRFSEDADDIVSASGRADSVEKLRYFLDGWKKQKGWYEQGQMGYEVFVGKKDGFFIRAYTAGDEDTILPLFNKVFGVTRTMEHWHWKFRDNPYGSHRIAEAFSAEGALVAHYAGYPIPFFLSVDTSSTFLSCQIGDTMTSPSVRNVGLGKTGLLARIAHYFYAKFGHGAMPFIYGFNTGNIRKLGTRYLGYEYIDPVTYWTRNLSESPMRRPSFLLRLLSGLSAEEVHSTNAEWDDLFRRVAPAYRLLVRRDAEYIKWRYLDCPDRIHRVFAVRKWGRLAGWSVFAVRGDRLIWGDALFDKECPGAVSFLLHNLHESFPGIAAVEGWFSRHPAWWEAILKENGFAAGPEPNELTPGFVIFQNGDTRHHLQDSLYYTHGDSDLF